MYGAISLAELFTQVSGELCNNACVLHVVETRSSSLDTIKGPQNTESAEAKIISCNYNRRQSNQVRRSVSNGQLLSFILLQLQQTSLTNGKVREKLIPEHSFYSGDTSGHRHR